MTSRSTSPVRGSRTARAQARTSAAGLSRLTVWAPRLQRVGGVDFVAIHPKQAPAEIVRAALAGGRGEHIHLANAYSVALADSAPLTVGAALLSDGWNLPDGRPLAVISHLRRDRPALHQVRGPQLFLDVCEGGLAAGLRHYLLGGAPDVLRQLQHALERRFPGIQIVGADSPPYRTMTQDELERRDEAILASGAHVVWVGLGTPRQDLEALRLAHSVPVIALSVGAAFDFAAGSSREAPRWVSAIGLEWAFRFASEPRRLWRRYLFGNLQFVRAVLRR